MKILILGAGAMGSLFGGRLAESRPDLEVTLADVWLEHVAAINEHGLKIEDENGGRTIKVKAVGNNSIDRVYDLIIVFTKVMFTEQALTSAKAAIGPNTWLLSLQNGLGAIDRLRLFAPRTRIIFGMTSFTSDLLGPGHIRTHGRGISRMMSADGQISPSLKAISEIFVDSGLDGLIDPEVERQIWIKAGFNAAFNSLCAITGLDCGVLGHSEEGRELLFGIAAESAAVARACGVNIEADDIINLLKESFLRHARHAPSMLQDIINKRATEIDALNGEISRLGRLHFIDTPINDTVSRMVKAISSAYSFRCF